MYRAFRRTVGTSALKEEYCNYLFRFLEFLIKVQFTPAKFSKIHIASVDTLSITFFSTST